MKRSEKKAISPLLATVMLIAFVLVLAILVWFWYSGVIGDYTEKSGIGGDQICAQDVSFIISSACNNADSVIIGVENPGRTHIISFKVVINGDTVETKETSTGVQMGVTAQISATYNATAMGTVQTVKLIPMIFSQGYTTECTENIQTANVISC
ncbi:hypothetical protein HOD61_00495 [archaeon]|jgi:flagellin-like protein|nr:hypothetical protein [archaeon]